MRVMFIGPLEPNNTGQSNMFNILVQQMKDFYDLTTLSTTANTNYICSKLIHLIKFVASTIIFLMRRRYHVVYISLSRGRYSYFRDIITVFLVTIFNGNCRLIGHLHGADLDRLYCQVTNIEKKLLSQTYKKFSRVIVLQEGMEKELHFCPSVPISIVENGVPDPYQDNDQGSTSQKSTIEILYLSNIMYSKGILTILDCLDQIKVRFNLTIAGAFVSDEFYTANEIERQFYERFEDHQDNVQYIGFVESALKQQILKTADILVLPTFYSTEAQPVCIIEAMASHCAIVVNEHNYLNGMVDCKSGFIGDINSPEKLALAINNLMTEPYIIEDIKKYNRIKFLERFTIDNHIKLMRKIINGT